MATHEVHESLHARRFFWHCDESDPDAELIVTTPSGHCRELLSVQVVYSAAVTVEATVTLISHAGASFDCLLQKIPLAAARYGAWTVEGKRILHHEDQIKVVAPAGSGVITSTVAVNMEAI